MYYLRLYISRVFNNTHVRFWNTINITSTFHISSSNTYWKPTRVLHWSDFQYWVESLRAASLNQRLRISNCIFSSYTSRSPARHNIQYENLIQTPLSAWAFHRSNKTLPFASRKHPLTVELFYPPLKPRSFHFRVCFANNQTTSQLHLPLYIRNVLAHRIRLRKWEKKPFCSLSLYLREYKINSSCIGFILPKLFPCFSTWLHGLDKTSRRRRE